MADKFHLRISQAAAKNLCKTCNYAGRLDKEVKPCNYHRCMNFLGVPAGKCALRSEDISRREKYYGTRGGKLII